MRSNGSASQEPGAPDADASHGDPPLSDAEVDAKVSDLAGLSDIAYGRERSKAAKAMDLPVAWLDKIVRSKKAEIIAQATGSAEPESGGQGRRIEIADLRSPR